MCDSLQDISVERLLAVAQELANHLSAQALPLQQKVGHAYGRVWDEATGDQELKALIWVSEEHNENKKNHNKLFIEHTKNTNI